MQKKNIINHEVSIRLLSASIYERIKLFRFFCRNSKNDEINAFPVDYCDAEMQPFVICTD